MWCIDCRRTYPPEWLNISTQKLVILYITFHFLIIKFDTNCQLHNILLFGFVLNKSYKQH